MISCSSTRSMPSSCGVRSRMAASAPLRKRPPWPGVHAVITATDIDIGGCVPIIPLRQESAPEFKPFQQPVIAHDKVRYVGEPVGVILAETQAAAGDGL